VQGIGVDDTSEAVPRSAMARENRLDVERYILEGYNDSELNFRGVVAWNRSVGIGGNE